MLAEAIAAEGFDVVALQEVNQNIGDKESNFAAAVVSRLSERGVRYDWRYLPVKIGYGRYDEGLAFLCRTPIKEVRSAYLTERRSYEDWKTRMALGVRCEGRDEWFFSIHTGWWKDPDEPFFDQWKRLSELLPRRERIWLMGDFNQPAEVRGEGYDLVRDAGWYDAYDLAEHRIGEGTARAGIDGWHGRAVTCDWLRIDQIHSNRRVKISSYRTLFDGVRYTAISDHFGVAVTVED